jgi:hypothetical protein
MLARGRLGHPDRLHETAVSRANIEAGEITKRRSLLLFQASPTTFFFVSGRR